MDERMIVFRKFKFRIKITPFEFRYSGNYRIGRLYGQFHAKLTFYLLQRF